MSRRVDFTVRCSDPQCRGQAQYKIAAEWSGGDITELKTFGFACDACLERACRAAQARADRIVCAEGEKISRMRLFRLNTKAHDYELERLPELEQRFCGVTNHD